MWSVLGPRVGALVAGALVTWAMSPGLASGEPVAGATDLALRSVSVNADNGMLRWTVQTAGVLNPSDVSPDPGAGPCLTWWTGASAAARVRLCLDGPFEPSKAPDGLKSLLARAGDAPDFRHLEAELVAREAEVATLFDQLIV